MQFRSQVRQDVLDISRRQIGRFRMGEQGVQGRMAMLFRWSVPMKLSSFGTLNG